MREKKEVKREKKGYKTKGIQKRCIQSRGNAATGPDLPIFPRPGLNTVLR